MKIGINALGKVSSDTGGKTYLYYFIKYLARYKTEDEIYIFLSSWKENIWGSLPENFHFVLVPFSNWNQYFKVLGEQIILPILALIKGIDVFYFPGNFISPLFLKRKIVAIRSTLYYHYPQQIPLYKNLYRRFMSWISVKLSEKIIVPSHDIKEDLLNFLKAKEEKIVVVPHGVEKEYWAEAVPEREKNMVIKSLEISRPFILFVSALWPYKGAENLIKAFKLVQEEKQFERYSLVIAGKGIHSETEALFELVDKLGLNNKVIFTGNLGHFELRVLYQTADLFVLPTMYESFGHPILEAMSSGVAVITSAKHAIPEIVGDAAFFIEPESVDSIAKAIIKLLSDAGLRRSFIEKGKERVSEFSWQRAVKKTLDNIKKP